MIQYIGTCPYFELGTESFICGVDQQVYQSLSQNQWWKDRTRINFFLVNPSEQEISILGQIIKEIDSDCCQMGSSRINVYTPVSEVNDDLGLQGISSRCYNFYVNLWDELTVGGIEKTVEYTFMELETRKCGHIMGRGVEYAIEVSVPDEFSVCYCASVDPVVFERAAVYSDIYLKVGDIEEYQKLLWLTEGDRSRRKRIYLALQDDSLQECNIHEDGFCIVTEEK